MIGSSHKCMCSGLLPSANNSAVECLSVTLPTSCACHTWAHPGTAIDVENSCELQPRSCVVMGILRTLHAFNARDQGPSFSLSWKEPKNSSTEHQLIRKRLKQRLLSSTQGWLV